MNITKTVTTTFRSDVKRIGPVLLPKFSDVRVMMLPIVLGDLDTLPDDLSHWRSAMDELFGMCPYIGEVGYLTIDEKLVRAGQTHRRAGLHVDGIYKNGSGAWGGDPGGWGKNGLLTVSNYVGCRGWNQEFEGWPKSEGECYHLASQCKPENEVVLKPGIAYWMNRLCVHESMSMPGDFKRTFVRLSMPSDAPWFEGYTINPKGVKPTGPILPRRSFMDE